MPPRTWTSTAVSSKRRSKRFDTSVTRSTVRQVPPSQRQVRRMERERPALSHCELSLPGRSFRPGLGSRTMESCKRQPPRPRGLQSRSSGRARAERALVLIDIPDYCGFRATPALLRRELVRLTAALNPSAFDLVAIWCRGRSAFVVREVVPGCGPCLSRGEAGQELIDRWPPEVVTKAVTTLVVCSPSARFAAYATACSQTGVRCSVVPSLRTGGSRSTAARRR
jgi:hypothetical protein